MMYNSKPGGPGTWPKRLMAVFGSVMLILSLIPTPGLAEALTEFREINDGGIEVVDDAPEQQNAEAVTLQEEEHIVGTDEADDEDVVATTQVDDANPYKLSTESVPHFIGESETPYDAANQLITWKISFEVPASGMRSFTITDTLPNVTANGKTYRDTLYDEYALDIRGVPMSIVSSGNSSSSSDSDVNRPEEAIISTDEFSFAQTDEGFVIDFYEGLPSADEAYLVEITVCTKIDQNWYSSSGVSNIHINNVALLPANYTTPFTATSNAVEVNPTKCEHKSGKYQSVDAKAHKWKCNTCNYYREDVHHVEPKEKDGKTTYACKECGIEGVRVSFNNGGGSGNMDNEYYAKGYEYVLPSNTKFKGPSGKDFYRWEVQVGDGSTQLLYPGEGVVLTDHTTLKATWSASVTYMDESWPSVQKTQVGYTSIGANTTTLESDWYAVSGSVNLQGKGTIQVKGDAKLILCSGCKLTTDGIEVLPNAKLTVYSQDGSDTGTITCNKKAEVAITNSGTLIVHGGTITGATEAGILVQGQSVFTGGIITNNAVGVKFGSSTKGSVSISRKPRITNNQDGNDILLPRNKYINIAGSLVAGVCRIGVQLPVPAGRVITRYYGSTMGDSDPNIYIDCATEDLKVASVLQDGEVRIYDPNARYLDANGVMQDIANYTPISTMVDSEGMPTGSLTKGWYTVNKDTVFESRLTTEGDVKLVLVDGNTLTCNEGIRIKSGSLTIYAQQSGSDDTVGKLIATFIEKEEEKEESSTNTDDDDVIVLGQPYAAIGGNEGDNATLNVYGGVIIANGATYGAGIGGGGAGGDGGNINIYGGKVVATGGYSAAGIGGGGFQTNKQEGNGGNITIYGGEVEAQGGDYAAGIGGGRKGAMGSVTIHGGTVKAAGGKYAAGIGSGRLANNGGTFTADGGNITAQGGDYGAGIGAGTERDGGTVDISGTARIVATGGKEAAGIGGGDKGKGGDVTISGDSCSVHVVAGETAQGIGNGSEGEDRDPGKLDLSGAALWASTDGQNHVLKDERVDIMRSQVAYLDPCEHTGADGAYAYTTEGHTVVCNYCDVEHSEPQPHSWNLDNECICGAKSGIIEFDENGGFGEIADGRYVIGCDYTLPECKKTDVEPPVVGTRFAYWDIDGQSYYPGDKVKFDSGKIVTATAMWTEVVLYLDESGEEVGTAQYRVLQPGSTEWDNDWYVAMGDGNVTIPDRVVVKGNTSLILRDNATVTLGSELYIEPGAKLDIYWQSGKSGKLYGPEDDKGGVIDDNNGFLWVGEGGTLNLYGGNIYGYTCVDNDGTFNMYNGNISSVDWSVSNNQNEANIYGGTISGGDWGISITGGKVNMHGGTIDGAGEGVEILTGLSGEFNMDGGTIQNSKSYGIRQEAATKLSISGAPKLQENAKCDIMLQDGAVISTGELGNGFTAVVALENEKGIFTSGFEINNPSLDPVTVFQTADSSLLVTNKDGEAAIESAGSIKYYDENGQPETCDSYRKLGNDVLTIKNGLAYLDAGWYLVSGEFAISNTLVTQGKVDLILEDGAQFTVSNGIRVEKGTSASSLEIWGGKEGTGSITVKTTNNSNQAGIGAQNSSAKAGDVIIHRGNIAVSGGKAAVGIECADGNTVKILGGTVVAERGRQGAAAIGCAATETIGTLVIGDKQSVSVDGNLVLASERNAACSNEKVEISPCKHENHTYETTAETHKMLCDNCLMVGDVEAHDINADGECTICGYADIVTITFAPGESGTGTMKPIEAKRGKAMNMPGCDFTNTDGKAFIGWQIGEQVIDSEQEYTPTENVTATALWGEGYTVFATSRTTNSSTTVVDITMNPAKDKYGNGSVVTITAPTKKGYDFQGWYEAITLDKENNVTEYGTEVLCSTLEYKMTVSKDTKICAVYKSTETVLVSIYGSGGNVYVTSSKGTSRPGPSWSQRISKGDTITMHAADPSTAKQWIDVKSNKILSRNPDYTLTIIDKTDITLLYNGNSEDTSSYVQWISDFDQVLTTAVFDTDTDLEEIASTYNGKPTKFGYTFTRWVFLGKDGKKTDIEATPEAIKQRVGIEPNIDLAPDYTPLAQKYKLTLHYRNAENEQIYKDVAGEKTIGAFVSVNARTINGYKFSCWKNDQGKVISYLASYKVQITRSKELYACYVDTNAVIPKPEPVVYLRRMFQDGVVDDTYYSRATTTITIPKANWEYVKAGFLYQADYSGANPDKFVFGARGVEYTVLSEMDSEIVLGQLVFSSTDPDEVWSIRGYLVARNKDDGKLYYFYSDIREASFNDLISLS